MLFKHLTTEARSDIKEASLLQSSVVSIGKKRLIILKYFLNVSEIVDRGRGEQKKKAADY